MSFGKGQRDDTKNNFLSKDTKARNNEAKRKQDDGWDGQGFVSILQNLGHAVTVRPSNLALFYVCPSQR